VKDSCTCRPVDDPFPAYQKDVQNISGVTCFRKFFRILLERKGRIDEARAIYQEGIEIAGRKGDMHAKGELQGALDLL